MLVCFHSTVASWLSYASFMRWGFEGMLQLQFKGNKYPVTIGNFTFEIDGIQVSFKKHFLKIIFDAWVLNVHVLLQVVEVLNMNQYPLYSCYLVLLAVCLAFMGLYYLCLKFIKQKSSQDW